VPFQPTIGSEALIIRTLATLVPRHYITREFMPSLRENSLCHSDPARFIRCFPASSSHLVLQVMFSALPFGCCIPFSSLFSFLVSLLFLCVCMYLTFPPLEGLRPILFLLPEESSGLQVSVVLWDDILQLYHASIHGGG
jgi:hypothetical protein